MEINFEEIDRELSLSRRNGTFNDDVFNVVKRFDGNIFTVRHVELALIKLEQMPKGKNPRARIAMALNKLRELEKVKIIRKGSGSIPYEYQIV